MGNNFNCDSCVFYEYDDEYDVYECSVNMDQDDLNRISFSSNAACPHYRSDDDYKIVKKQL